MLKRVVSAFLFPAFFLYPTFAEAATAIDVPPAARSMAQAVREEAKTLIAHKKYLAETEKYLAETEKTIAELETQFDPARQRYAEVQAEQQKIRLDKDQIAQRKEAALKRFESALADVNRLQGILDGLEQSVLYAESGVYNAERVWERSPRPENRNAFENAQDNLQRVTNNRDSVAVAFERAEIRMADAQEELDRYTAMESDLTDNQYNVDDAKTVLENLETDYKYLVEQRDLVKKSLLDARAPVNLKDRKWKYVMADIELYNWKDNDGNKGHQFYMPLSYGWVDGAFSYGIRTGFISSNNKSRPNGSVSTMDDTTLAFGYTKQYKKFDVLYTLSMNLPTGKETLYGSDPIMSDDLVRHARFGEGFGVTPGIIVSWKPNEKDTWSVGTSYSFNRKYRYDSSIPDGWINPANGWDSFLRYQHAGEKNQFIFETLLTSYSGTRDNGVDYTQGNQLEPHFIYNRVLSDSQDLMFYYWYVHEGAPDSPDPTVASGTGRKGHFLGTMWSKQINAKNTFHITADYMKRTGQSYDSLTNLYSSDREKFSYGIGYDYAFSESSKISLNIERFNMKDHDGGTVNSKYHGYNVFLRYFIYW